MMRNRIQIGFHRLGVALLFLPILGAVVLIGMGAYQWCSPIFSPPVFEFTNEETNQEYKVVYASDPLLIGKQLLEAFKPTRVPEKALHSVEEAMRTIDRERSDGMGKITFGGGLFAMGIVLYGFAWMVGWILRGFVGEG